MTTKMSAAMAALNGLDVKGLNAVISQARTLRAKEQIRRMSELVTVPVEVKGASDSDYNDHGSSYSYWTAEYAFVLASGKKVNCTSGALSDDLSELTDDEIADIERVFGADRGLSEDAVQAAMSEFAELSLGYAAFCSDGEDEIEYTIEPAADLVAAPVEADQYSNECVLHLTNGHSIHVPAFPEDCSYVRVLDASGAQTGYWVEDEWREDPSEVMGAIMGAAKGGAA